MNPKLLTAVVQQVSAPAISGWVVREHDCLSAVQIDCAHVSVAGATPGVRAAPSLGFNALKAAR